MTMEKLNQQIKEKKSQYMEKVEKFLQWKKENEKNYKDITLTKEYKNQWGELKKISKELKELTIQKEELEGKIWNADKWATEYISVSTKSLEDAREKLANMLKAMNGVEISECKGVRNVQITSKYKIYQYTIHAHYTHQVVGYKKRINPWTKKEEDEPIYEQVYAACLHTNKANFGGQNWAWRN